MPLLPESRFFFNPSNPISSLYNRAILTVGGGFFLFFFFLSGMIRLLPLRVSEMCQRNGQNGTQMSLYCDRRLGFGHYHRDCFFFSVFSTGMSKRVWVVNCQIMMYDVIRWHFTLGLTKRLELDFSSYGILGFKKYYFTRIYLFREPKYYYFLRNFLLVR